MKKFLAIIFLILPMVYSCTEADVIFHDEVPQTLKGEIQQDELTKIINFVFPTKRGSRANENYTVNTIFDANGNPAINVVNFDNNGGFLLVSASKKHYPILAHSDKGHFSISNLDKPDEVAFWQSYMIESIINAEVSSDSIDSTWEPFLEKEQKPEFERISQVSRSGDPFIDQIEKIVADSLASWRKKGYEILSIDDYEPRNEDEVNDIKELRYNMYPMDADNWKDYVFVVKFQDKHDIVISDIMKSTWNQNGGYNEAHPTENGIHKLAGCVPVAAGQIMRYHKKPITINWDAMPLNYPTLTTSQFLYELGKKANTDFGIDKSSCGIKDIKKALESYGYKCTESKYSHSAVLQNIGYRRPVLMFGKDTKNDKAHAWVISGANVYDSANVTLVYYFMQPNLMTTRFQHYDNRSYIYGHYCNWGWGGSYDGFYGMGRFSPTSDRNYNNDLKMIENIYY